MTQPENRIPFDGPWLCGIDGCGGDIELVNVVFLGIEMDAGVMRLHTAGNSLEPQDIEFRCRECGRTVPAPETGRAARYLLAALDEWATRAMGALI